jgi:hypothetical protein
VWKETADSSMVTILSIIDMERRQTIAKKKLARSHPLLLHFVSQELRDPSCRLLCEVQVMSKGEIDHSLGDSMGPSKFIQGHSPVILNVGGDIGDKRQRSLLPL